MNYLALTNAVQRRTRLVTDVNATLLDDKDLSCLDVILRVISHFSPMQPLQPLSNYLRFRHAL